MKRTILKIYTILFILANLLPMNWSMDIDQAIAQSKLPLDFDQHYKYKRHVSDGNYRTSWELDVDFPNGEIRARWIFRIEQQQAGSQKTIVWGQSTHVSTASETWVLTDEFIQNIQCAKHGEVTIQNGKARFNPSTRDYITCQTPNFKEVVEEMSSILALGIAIDSSNICASCLDPWMNAAVKIQGPEQEVYPMGYLKSLSDSTIFQSEVGFDGDDLVLSTHMTDWMYPERSQPFAHNGKHHLFTGMNVERFLHTLATRNASQYTTPWTQYWSSVHSLASDVEEVNAEEYDWFSWVEDAQSLPVPREAQVSELSNGAQLFYIGHNPKTGEFFHGTMYNIGVDPGCIGA